MTRVSLGCEGEPIKIQGPSSECPPGCNGPNSQASKESHYSEPISTGNSLALLLGLAGNYF